MKILAIVGTNRKKGNVTKLCEKILEGANENGHQGELINLYDYKINYCTGCWACSNNGNCSQNDDFDQVYNKVVEADVIVIGSPVYWGSVTGIMKNFFDRHSGKMNIPQEVRTIYKESLFKKVKFAIASMKTFGPKDEKARKKKFILISAATSPFRFLLMRDEIPPAINAMKVYVSKMKGKTINKLVYTDTLIQFRNQKAKMMNRAFKIGKRIK